MKLKEYHDELSLLIKNHPEILMLDVVYSSDDEGNSYNRVHYTPTIGCLIDELFVGTNEYEDEQESYDKTLKDNSICIN